MGSNGALNVACTQCKLPAQKAETVLEERAYGDRFVVLITGRIFHHFHEDGNKKVCTEKLGSPWCFTLCDADEIHQVRQITAAMMGKFGDTKLLKFV